MTCIPLHQTLQMNLIWTSDPPVTRVEMTCIPLHKTWQMNLLWPMDPQDITAGMTCIPLHKNLADEHTLANGLPFQVPEQRWLAYHYTKLGRWTYFADEAPTHYQTRDDLKTNSPNLTDKPTLANGPPTSTRADMTCIPLHKIWQMNLLWLINIYIVPDQRWLENQFTKLGR